MKTKIAYVIPTLSLGGAEKQQVNILNGIDTEKFDVKLYILKNKTQLLPQIRNNKIDVEICHINSPTDIKEIYSFIRSIRSFNPDIIHSQMYNANILVRVLKVFVPGSKIVNHFHGMSQWMSKTKLLIDKMTSFLVDRFIVVSQKSYDLRAEREQYPKDKMMLLYNSVDISPSVEKKIDGEDKRRTIGMASRLIPLKNIEGALFMLSTLLKSDLDVDMIIAGDGPEKEKIEKYAVELGIVDRVTFLGFVSKMEQFYQQIDIYCISSFTEDLPLSVVEAMMTGKPVIASNVGGIPDIVNCVPCTHLVNDFFDLQEINEVYGFLKNLKIDECKDNLMDYAMANFDNKAYCMKLADIYIDLLEEI